MLFLDVCGVVCVACVGQTPCSMNIITSFKLPGG